MNLTLVAAIGLLLLWGVLVFIVGAPKFLS